MNQKMAVTFKWYCSFQNELEYEVFGHPFIRRIEAYRECHHGMLDYQRSTYNHNGNSEEFERIMVARQGGVMIRSIDKSYNAATYWADHRWEPEFYQAFVQWLKDEHASYLVEHERRRIARGWTLEEYPYEEQSPIPRPMFYNPETRGYEVEPWFQPEMASLESAAGLLAA
jgi:hypothetical protein